MTDSELTQVLAKPCLVVARISGVQSSRKGTLTVSPSGIYRLTFESGGKSVALRAEQILSATPVEVTA